ncbi:anti-sigma factor family protein [Salinispira pacifica]
MSPERDFISAYLDGEVPSPWKERIQRSIEESPEMRKAYEAHRRVSDLLARAPEPDFSAARGRVWDVLEARLSNSGAAPQGDSIDTRPGAQPAPLSLWRRRVSLPVPVAVAAAAVFVFFVAFSVFRFVSGAGADGAAMAQSVEGLNVTVNVKDVEQLIDILNGQNKIREVKIELPEPHQFRLMGEPLLLRASDSGGGLR